MDEPTVGRIDILENAVMTMERKFEMLIKQKVFDAGRLDKLEYRIAKLEALHRDDGK